MARQDKRSKTNKKNTVRRLQSTIAGVAFGSLAFGTTAQSALNFDAGALTNRLGNSNLGKLTRVPARPVEPSDELVAEVSRLRKEHGFQHDTDFVRDLLRNPAKYGAKAGPESGGHYATPEELEQLRMRRLVQSDARRVQSTYKHDPEYAGAFIGSDGLLHVGFTRLDEERLAEILESSDQPQRVRHFLAERSLQKLEGVKKQISHAIPQLALRGLDVTRVAVDVETNSVQIGVDELDNQKEFELRRLFGDVQISELPLELPDHRSDTASPMRAGVRISMSSGGSCTSAWKARDRSTGQLVMLTAGHCAPGTGAGSGVGTVIRQGTTSTGAARSVGTVDQSTWVFPVVLPGGARFGSGPVDALRFPLTVGSLPWLYGWDNAAGSGGESLEVKGASGSVVVGQSVCNAGQFSPGNATAGNFKNCGTVAAVNVSRTFARSSGSPDRFTITNANQGTYTSIPGDSGGAVWHYGPGATIEAVGINTGGSTAEYFSDIDRVENALNVDIRTY